MVPGTTRGQLGILSLWGGQFGCMELSVDLQITKSIKKIEGFL